MPAAAEKATKEAPRGRAATIAPGDRVVLVEPDTGYRYLIEVDAKGARKEKGLGVFDPQRLVGVAYGAPTQVGAKHVVPLRPTLEDLSATVRRKAQVILPKDVSRIVHELGIGPGDHVLESGIGSGAATLALAWAVGETGRVSVQELRPEFTEWAMDNLRRAGLDARVKALEGDLTKGLAAGLRGPFQAVLLDQPEPWLGLPNVLPELDAGAHVAAYCPQVVQVEETVRTLRRLGFADVRAMELIERQWEVKERGSRPSFEGLGHTGFLVFARWLGQPVPQVPPAPGTGLA